MGSELAQSITRLMQELQTTTTCVTVLLDGEAEIDWVETELGRLIRNLGFVDHFVCCICT